MHNMSNYLSNEIYATVNATAGFFVKGAVFLAPRFLTSLFFGLVLGFSITQVSFAADEQQANQISLTSHATVSPVIELYTSEGCSSCPQADDFMTELGHIIKRSIDGDASGQEFHAVPLAFHVDYWNRLGWVDPYSKPEFTERQREIGRINNQRSIYTPEFVVAGEESRGGSDVVDRIKQSNSQEATVAIGLSLKAVDTDKLEADFTIDNHAAKDAAQAYVAIYENNIVREIVGGENKGRTLTHNYVVRHWSNPIQLSEGITNKSASLKIDDGWVRENLGFAVIVVNRENGKTLQALNTPLATLFPI